MCGICGELRFGQGEAVEAATLVRMADALRHRGPDDDGLHLSPDRRFGIAFRRLSIVDLATGAQPMSNEDGSVWVVFNGEIYNHQALRAELERRGHVYRSRADTECLVHLYEDYGPDLVHHLRGMFAFALWDERAGRLLLARDRLGIKPLYYATLGGRLLFASEIKALLRHPALGKELDAEALYHYLTFATTPAPRTLFSNVHKLAPGHLLMAGSDGAVSVRRYWDPLVAFQAVESPRAEAECVERLRGLLRESVRLRMMSDVPFGVYLSGGLDSSLNVALMSELMDRPVDTYSVAIEGQDRFNELDQARAVARHFGARHREVVVGEREFLEALPAIVYHQDEPLADPVCVPLYYLARLTRASGTIVVQVGEGSDELFCGYRGYVQFLEFYRRAWRPFRALPSAARLAAWSALGRLLSPTQRDFLRRGVDGGEVFWGGAVAFWETEKRALLARDGFAHSSASAIVPIYAHYDQHRPDAHQLDRMTYLELHLRLPELLLMRVDKMTMAHSVEARVPYLDHKLVEFALTVPPELKLRNGTTKYLLKQAARGIVPDWVIERRKMGFCGSASNMLSPGLLAVAERDVLTSPLARAWFDLEYVRRLFLASQQGAADYNFRLWNLWNLALWHRVWFESPAAA